MRFFLFCFLPLIGVAAPIASERSLQALQQLRDEIPERLWAQEFSINLNRSLFRPCLIALIKKHQMAMKEPPKIAFGQSTCFFLQKTISGEEIRILDSYLKFLNSPFWQTPIYLKRFNQMRRSVWQGDGKSMARAVSGNALKSADAEEVLGDLKAIVLLADWEQVKRQPEAEGVVSMGIDLLTLHPSFLRELSEEYLGKSFGLDTIQAIQQQIADFYRSKNQPFVVVEIPKQDLTQGIVQLVVEEARLGEVRVVGNRYSSPSFLEGKIQTKPGQVVITKEILDDLSLLNQSPFRRVDGMFVPGKIPGTTDLELVTIDRWPYRFYTGADNTGTVATERNRVFLGFNFGNTVWRDAQLSYQFTCAPNWNRFFSHTAMYRLPFSWGHTAIFYAGYSQVEPEGAENVKDKGVGWQVDGRYRIPVGNSSWLLQAIVLGYDFKQVSNRIDTQDGHTKAVADINQFSLGYELGAKGKDWKVSFALEGFGNPGGISTNNTESSYERFRYAGKAQYGYFKLSHSFARQKSGWWFSYNLTGQFATANLLPSEQMTLAGYYAVRGFEERIVNVDNGAVVNLEVETPRWSPARTFGSSKSYDELYAVFFFDSGFGADHNSVPGRSNFLSLGSAGPSLRYQYSRYVSAHLDYGFQLWHRGFHNPADSHYNFGVTISY